MGPFPIGGKFIFYWYPVDQFWVGANGYIAFNDVNIASPFPNIPDSTIGLYNFIAPMLCDLSFAGQLNSGRVLYQITTDSLIVSYINVPFWAPIYPSYTGSNTFQVILNRVDKSITFNYQKQVGPTEGTVTGGIENLTGTIGLEALQTYQPDGYSIKFYYPDTVKLKVSDGGINRNKSGGGKGFFISFPYNNLPLVTDVANFGNQNINGFSVSGTVIDPLGTIVVSSNVNITNTLQASDDTIITFPVDFTPVITGNHFYSKIIRGVKNDKYPSDDSLKQEIVVIDTSLIQMNLSYAKVLNPNDGISWEGGTGGVGVYIKPPTYPVKIVSTSFVISFKPQKDSSNFYVKIYDDKGLNGTAGNLLDSEHVDASKIQVIHKTVVPVNNNIIIYNGGVYIAWIENGSNIELGVDDTPPFSRQTYEDLNGTFAQYRDSEGQDFFIELNVKKSDIADIGVSSISNLKMNSVIKHPLNISCYIKNYGQLIVDSNFYVWYSMDYGNVITEHYKGKDINPGDSELFAFSTPLYISQDSINGYLCVGTKMQSDYNPLNDSLCVFVKIYNTTSVYSPQSTIHSLSIYPNPVNSFLVVSYQFIEKNPVNITLYDIMGREVADIINKDQGKGEQLVKINTQQLDNNIYILKIRTQDIIDTKKIVVQH